MSDNAAAASNKSAAEAKTAPQGAFDVKSWGFVLIAGIVAGLALFLAVGRTAASGPPGLAAVARADIENAILSMDQTAGAKAAEEARQCKTPLAYITLQAASGSAAEVVKIRSGSYTSPALTLTDGPRRIAIPFPAPYPAGNGQIFVDGATRDVTLWLTPAITVGPRTGINMINVVWSTANPCPP